MLDLRRGAAIAVFALVGAGRLLAQSAPAPTPPVIVTSGQGEVRIAPDRATVSIGVQSRALTAVEASSTNARKQKAVIDAIRAKGVPADRIATEGFNVQPETRYDRPNMPPVTTGYLVSNVVNVDLQRPDMAGAVIDAAIAAGANQINSLTFSISNADSARRAALSIAVARAKGDAEVIARAAGGSLGGLIELSATDYEPPRPKAYAGVMRLQESAIGTPVEAGLQSVQASVVARWRFVPSP